MTSIAAYCAMNAIMCDIEHYYFVCNLTKEGRKFCRRTELVLRGDFIFNDFTDGYRLAFSCHSSFAHYLEATQLARLAADFCLGSVFIH